MPGTQPETSAAYRPRTTADSVGARMRDALFEGRFVPGQAVSIRRIAEEEGISVIPARDALRGLVAEGALEFKDSRTIIVPFLDTDTLAQLRHARLAIEGELAWRAFPALRGRIGWLKETDDRVSAALTARDASGYMRANRELHFGIYEAAGASVLLSLAEKLWLRFAPSMRIVCDAFDGRLPGADHHQRAIAALEAGDRAEFRAALESDIAQGMDTLLDHAELTNAAAAARRGRS